MPERTATPGEAVTRPAEAPAPGPQGHYWERARRGAAPWIIGAVGLAALGIGQLVPMRHHMESDLRARSRTALDAAGLKGVVADFTGRDGTLTGVVGSAADRDRALQIVRSLDGVRVADGDLSMPGAVGASPSASASESASASPSASESASPSASESASPSASESASPSASASASASPSPSPSPSPSDANGTQQALTALPAIGFETGSATLTPAGRTVVAQVAKILAGEPAVAIRVNGYTDDLGDWDVNKGLSTARANTVRTTLIADGIAASRLSSFGWSEENPKVPNTSAANRAVNRRVELVVVR